MVPLRVFTGGGGATVCACVQSWRNFTAHPRKALIVSWVAADVPFGVGNIEGLGKHLAALRGGLQRWVPNRAHIVPTEAEYHRRMVANLRRHFCPLRDFEDTCIVYRILQPIEATPDGA